MVENPQIKINTMSKRILVLSPETFSGTGGIQSMSRTLCYILHQLCQKNGWSMQLYALNDASTAPSAPYLPAVSCKGFRRNKILFTLKCIWAGRNKTLIIVNHVNLSFPAIVIRIIYPRCKIWLVAHGTEAWQPLSGWRKTIWQIADRIICVSSFTRDKVIALQQANPNHCVVLNNIADPFIPIPEDINKPGYLVKRYGLKHTDKVVLTLTRITANDQAKGYDQVIRAISKVKLSFPNIHYLLAGPCQPSEKIRIEQLVAESGMSDHFTLTGYIAKEELAHHYLLADLFVLPSSKEGFGIVLLEAMTYGLPIICGNKDGSIDAVRHEGMGTAIDPGDPEALELAIRKKLHQTLSAGFRKSISQEALKYFNEQQYSRILAQLISDGK
jgi:phosphatidylinositol alpha-1,6-mannosyltransferase